MRYSIINKIITLIFILTPIWCYASDFSLTYKGNVLHFKIVGKSEVELAPESLTDNNYSKLKNLEIPHEAYWIDVNYTVVGIGGNAFANCSKLESVIFPTDSAFTYINTGAFAYCTNLKTISIPSTIKELKTLTFAWSGLTQINIHDSITSIGDRCFSHCISLEQANIGKNVKKIGHQAFAYCLKLTEFTFPLKLQSIGYDVLIGCENISQINYNSENCFEFGSYLDPNNNAIKSNLSNLPKLKTIFFDNNIKAIPSYLLYNCYSLRLNIDSIIPISVNYIGESAFENTPWQKNKASKDIIYINNIAYAFNGEKDTLTHVELHEDTKSISPYCFADCENLKTVKFSGSEEYIHYRAFNYCNSLKSINFPTSISSIGDFAFANCDSLETIKLSNGNKSIGKYCFANCYSLDSIYIPKTITKIGTGAFFNNPILSKAIIDADVKAIPRGMFSKCRLLTNVSITSNVDSILGYAFAGCEYLEDISIPDNVSYIGLKAFSHCYELRNFNFGSKPKRIENYAFYRCYNLDVLDLSSVSYIGHHAFEFCKEVYDITLSEQLDTIGDWAFYDLPYILNLTIPQSVEYIGIYAFGSAVSLANLDIKSSNGYINRLAFSACHDLKNVKLSIGIKHIGDYAFANCINLENISIPDSITHISTGAFKQCSSLKVVKLSRQTTNIGEEAFYNCSRLVNVFNNQSLDTINSYAFSHCSSLKSFPLKNDITYIADNAFNYSALDDITIPERVKYIGENAFANCKNLTTINYNATNAHFSGNQQGAFANGNNNVTINFGPIVNNIPAAIFSKVNVKNINIPNNITSIGEYSFANNDSLKNVIYQPSRGVNISNLAFYNTPWASSSIYQDVVYLNTIALYPTKKNPSKIVIKEGTKSIASNFTTNNKNLTELHIPESLECIGKNAFMGCSNLDSINLTPSITNIYDYAFANCEKIRNINIPNDLTYIGENAFAGCSSIKNIDFKQTKTHIGWGAFSGCSKLSKVRISNNITKIEGGAFAFCYSLSYFSTNDFNGNENNFEFILPEKLDSIKQSTFFNCNLAGNIELPFNVQFIDAYAFSKNNYIKTISFDWKTNNIHQTAFCNNNMLTKIIANDDNTSYFTDRNGILYKTNDSSLIFCPNRASGSISISKSTSEIKSSAFENCQEITSVGLSNSLKRILDKAFFNCNKLQNISINKSVELIGELVFDQCSLLSEINVDKDNRYYTSENGILYNKNKTILIKCPESKSGVVIIPSSVVEIKNHAFYNCKNISSIKLHKNVKIIDPNAFDGSINIQK